MVKVSGFGWDCVGGEPEESTDSSSPERRVNLKSLWAKGLERAMVKKNPGR